MTKPIKLKEVEQATGQPEYPNAILEERLPEETGGVTLVEEGVGKPESVGGNLFLTIEGPNPEALLTNAKKLAWASRVKFGFTNAGIDTYSPPFPVDKEGKAISNNDVPASYRIQFKLQPSFARM